jgi:hypothetical protein
MKEKILSSRRIGVLAVTGLGVAGCGSALLAKDQTELRQLGCGRLSGLVG